MYNKNYIIDCIWQYSRYYGNLLISCEELAKERNLNGHSSLVFLFNILEYVIKARLNDYDIKFFDAIKKLKKNNYINDIEYDFLNNKEYGIRRIRNLLAHANLSKYNVVFSFENEDLLFPLTENETVIKFYELSSGIIFNLMLKLIGYSFVKPISVNIDDEIKRFKIEIKELTPEEILKYKGFREKDLVSLNQLSEDEKYRMAENSSDVNHYVEIFKMLGIKKDEED